MICRICGHTKHQLLYSQKPFTIQNCVFCGFGSLDPFPTSQELDLIYNSETYHDDKSAIEHQADAKKKMGFVKKHLRKHDLILDYGCGTGAVLTAAQKFGLQTKGYDIAKVTAQAASKTALCPIQYGDPKKELFHRHEFRAITSFDVIEHIIDFKPIIKLWHYWLQPNGLLFLTTPDLSSWDHRLFGKRWYGYTKIPQHINYFNRQTITKVLTAADFKIISIGTWGFSRSLDFISRQLPLSNLSQSIINSLRLQSKTLYVPMIDMMVVAQKK